VSDPVLNHLVRKLATRMDFDDADREAVMSLPYLHRTHQPPTYLVREGEPPKKYCSFVISGLALRQKHTALGTKQIMSIHMRGDFLDLQHLFLSHADHNVQALTVLETADIERTALQQLILERPAVGRAMWVEALIDASIFREWIVNVGRRDARSRISHLLCEFALRMRAAGLSAQHGGYELPMTQEQLADAVGLTPVHVNRTLKALAAEGLIHREKRMITLLDWDRLRSVGDFSSLYLHLEDAAGP
jgi:CRP-like cAMP-binding protein